MIILAQYAHPSSLIDKPAYRGSKPILLATCEEGHLEMVDVLLECGPSLEIRAENGSNALQAAIKSGYGTVGRRLLQAGARNDLIDPEGRTLRAAAIKALEDQEEASRCERTYIQMEPSRGFRKHSYRHSPIHSPIHSGVFDLLVKIFFHRVQKSIPFRLHTKDYSNYSNCQWLKFMF
jgi:hypothetical protein